jgi:hypothetical protein
MMRVMAVLDFLARFARRSLHPGESSRSPTSSKVLGDLGVLVVTLLPFLRVLRASVLNPA